MKKIILIALPILAIVIVSAAIAVSNMDSKSVGFWKQQFEIAMGYKTGNAQYTYAELESFLSQITPGFSVKRASDIFWLREGSEAINKAERECLAAKLNKVVGLITDDTPVKIKGVEMTYAQATADAYTGEDYDNNQEICKVLNRI